MSNIFGDLGLSLLRLIAMILPLVLAGYIGTAMANRGVARWLYWAVGICALVIGYAIFLPSLTVLDSAMCRHADDYHACMDGDETDIPDWT